MWIVNKYGWIGNGNIDQCICINIREGGDPNKPNPIYPVNYNWTNNLVYVGREVKINSESMDEAFLISFSCQNSR